MVQGQLVNGSVGKVIDFLTPLEASREGISLSEDILEHRSISEPGNGRKGFGNRVRYYPERDGPETSGSRSRRWPVVRFQAGETMLCMEEYFDVNNAEGKVEATRSQVGHSVSFRVIILIQYFCSDPPYSCVGSECP